MRKIFGSLLLLSLGSPAAAQQPAATVIAIPPLTSPDSGTKGNEMLAIGWNVTQAIEADLRQTAEVMPLKPNRDDYYPYPEVTGPNFTKWRQAKAKTLITGFVQGRSDGRVTVGCYVYDVDKARELGRKGFIIGANDWRRAAHKCSGLAYTAITGAAGIFDTRVAYVAESGVGEARTRRIAVMDSDGQNHRYVTSGDSMDAMPVSVATPELRFQVDEVRKFAIIEEVRQRLSSAGAKVDATDGVRVSTSDGWWLLRASNTQDVLVARAEADDQGGLDRLVAQIDGQLAESGVERVEAAH